MTKAQKKHLCQILISAAIFTTALFIPAASAWRLPLFVAAYLISGLPILRKSFRNLLNGRIFDENLLMTIATLAAFAIKEYPEAVAVMLFFQIGEFFQNYAVNRSRGSIAKLMDLRPDSANLLCDGNIIAVSPEKVAPGEIILVRPGEKIPLDGQIIKGCSALDTSALTGESLPRDVVPGNEVLSGCINLNGVLQIKVTKEFSRSTVSRILELVETAGTRKAAVENFITRFARWYTPAVVIMALLLAILPPLLLDGAFHTWIYRAVTFLVISCPCALVISIPLSFFGGIGAASRQGILVKGSCYLELLSQIKCLVMDKTGTLTKGSFAVSRIIPSGISEQELLQTVAYAEAYSGHPVAQAVKNAWPQKIDRRRISALKELPGLGVSATIDGRSILAGNLRLMKQNGVMPPSVPVEGTAVHLSINGTYAGCIIVADTPKENAAEALRQIKKQGIEKLIMLTGDRTEIAQNVAAELNIDEVRAELLPQDKVGALEQILQNCAEKTAFVGDGINDAPVLARADLGIAMGKMGSDAAIEAADIVIMNDDLSKISAAVKIARKTIDIARQNIVFAIGVKLLVLLLGGLGFVSIWAAVFADVGVSVIAILNALRA